MTGSLTLGILAAFVGFVAIVGVSVWRDRRRRVPAAATATSAEQEDRHA